MKILFIDVETTGVDAEKCAITQIGAILDDFEREKSERLNLKVRPHADALIEEEALKITGITREDLESEDRLSPNEAYSNLMDMCQFPRRVYAEHRVFMCGYNILGFDQKFIYNMAHRAGDMYPHGKFHWPGIDVAPIASFYLGEKRRALKNFKLMTAAAALGINVEEMSTKMNMDAHDAMFDIEVTRKMYYMLAKKMRGGWK